MPNQVAVRPNAKQMNLVHDRRLTPEELYTQTKFLVKNNQLPPQLENIPGDSKYIPVFYTEDAKQIVQYKPALSTVDRISTGTGFLGFVAGLGFLLDSSVAFAGESMVMTTLAVASTGLMLMAPVRFGRKASVFRKMTNRINTAAVQPFSDWLKARYGVVEAEEDRNRNSTHSYFSVGIWDGQAHTMGFTDSITGSEYEAHKDADGHIYLTLVKRGKAPVEAEVTAPTEAPVTRQARLVARAKTMVSSSPSALPQKANDLQEQLEAAIMLLKEQDMTVEVKHQVERTETVTQTVVAKHQHISKISASAKADRDLETFFRTQLMFIKSLLQEQADELTREMNVEINAAAEAAGMNRTLLEMQE
jgi:hypothetical protein